MRYLVLLVLLSLGLSGCESLSIYGTVLNERGKPVAGAVIEVELEASDPRLQAGAARPQRATSNEKGEFVLRHLRVDDRLIIRAPDYETLTEVYDGFMIRRQEHTFVLLRKW